MLSVGDRVRHTESGRAGTIDAIAMLMVDDPDHPHALTVRLRLDGTSVPVHALLDELTPLRKERSTEH
jgi:hypothetical protein